ncbi:MAG: efflux RND transporter periplasmic adaptor subunit [Lysobacterales bacterium]
MKAPSLSLALTRAPTLALSLALAAALVLPACDSAGTGDAPAARSATPVTVVAAAERPVEVLERSVGRLEAPGAPAVAAETAGRVEAVHVDAGHTVGAGDLLAQLDDEVQVNTQRAARANVERLEALLDNQQRTVARFEDLVGRKLAAESALDDASSQLAALTAQLSEARARLDDAERNLRQVHVLSPVSGVVQARRVSVGDFVSVGQPLFDIVVTDRLQAIAPFPETIGNSLRVGQKAYVAPIRAADLAGAESIATAITELRPQIGAGSRSVQAILEFDNPGDWRAGGSVTVAVVVDARQRSVSVPPQSIVRRPAGTVVYVVEDGVARERVVEVGVQSETWVEILEGLRAGETVVLSGAGFLTDGTAVEAGQAAE